ncbi:anaphase-promoting complex subunit 10-like [Panicum miliaceum]|uniref:Anaphase-promoting complex subunit 10-like n=1 Tax=Panicum miliaceum TaxID=4540 RepID=A0A3L6TKN9_PANMI|nr:anaphase-promoting complex subunit 10-like [Panicum miliaceum]
MASDGAQPHLVNIQFQKKVQLQLVVLYVDFKLDESYTPSKISIRAGDGFHNLKEIKTVELAKPVGWVHISLSGADPRETFIHTFMLQIAILSNHLNGRDTHIRQIKIYGPRPPPCWSCLLKIGESLYSSEGYPRTLYTVEFGCSKLSKNSFACSKNTDTSVAAASLVFLWCANEMLKIRQVLDGFQVRQDAIFLRGKQYCGLKPDDSVMCRYCASKSSRQLGVSNQTSDDRVILREWDRGTVYICTENEED